MAFKYILCTKMPNNLKEVASNPLKQPILYFIMLFVVVFCILSNTKNINNCCAGYISKLLFLASAYYLLFLVQLHKPHQIHLFESNE
jgi:hypothetical protein